VAGKSIDLIEGQAHFFFSLASLGTTGVRRL